MLSSDTDRLQISAGQWALAPCLLLAALVLLVPAARAATNDLTTAIQRGLFEEEANQNLGAAIQAYQSVASQFDKDRKLAATAIFRLGECYRKQGNTNDAAAQYERILRDFSDQPTLVTLSRQNLTGMGKLLPKVTETATPATSTEADEVKHIEALIKDSPDLINAPDANTGETLLQSAAAKGKLAVVKVLLENGAAVDGFQQPGLTPLHYAAANGHKAIIDFLLSKGAKPDSRTESGVTPLHFAAQKGYESVAKALLAAGAPVNAKTKDRTSFGGSLTSSKTSIVPGMGGPLTNLKYDIGSGETPLHLAASSSYPGMVELLLAKGADPNAEDAEGRTPLSYGAQKPQVMQLLLAAHANPNTGRLNLPLAKAAYEGDMAALKLLLANGADPNTNSMVDWSITARVAMAGTSIVQRSLDNRGLTERGVPNLREPWPTQGIKFSPLFLAVSQQHADATKELLRYKANPNLKDPRGNPLLYQALADAPTLKVLLESGADPNVRLSNGTPLLDQALSDRNRTAVELLLAHQADVNIEDGAPDSFGKYSACTPLMLAAVLGDTAMAELLLKAGADVNARNHYYAGTALEHAVMAGHREMAELLLAHKADPNARDNDGHTPLSLAESKGIPLGTGVPNPMGPTEVYPYLPPRTPKADPGPESKPEAMGDLLRRHGALDDLPRLDLISVRRGSEADLGFRKDGHDWGQYTLLDLIGVQYGFLASSLDEREVAYTLPRFAATHARWAFPDLAHVRIRRVTLDQKTWQDQVVDLRPVLESGDCSKDVPLEWGDVVEFAEADHSLNETWPGFTTNELANLQKCLTRHVQLVVGARATALTLRPSIWRDRGGSGELMIGAPIEFWLKPVLLQSKLVRVSSDLSRVKITRHDPATGQQRQWVVDCSEVSHAPAPDFWLRDGDRIEVPEKVDASSAAAPGPQSEAPK
jgi:ankyrin repeat protein